MRTTLIFLTAVSAAIAQAPRPEWRVVYHPPGMDQAKVTRDISFGVADLKMDVYSPAEVRAGARRPVVLFVSGASKTRDWPGYQAYGKIATTYGLIGVVPDKRYERELGGLVSASADTQAAMDYLRLHAADFHADPDKFCLWTFSAGGRVTSAGMQEQPYIRCLVSYYGVLDIASPDPAFRNDEAYMAKYSPLRRLIALGAKTPPILVGRAGRDDEGLNRGIASFVAEAQKQNAPLTLINYPDGRHGFDGFDDTETSRDIIRATFQFILNFTR